MPRNRLVHSPLFRNAGLTINYVDVGARGDVDVPWSEFDDEILRVIGFEPDPVECARLAETYPQRKYYPNALWSSADTRPFYLCENQPTSSMYPPNEESNHKYAEQHWKRRVPVETLAIDCVTLDSVLAPEDAPDFLKIDTQGSELDILKGAATTLEKYNPLVLTETWCAEIYKGAPMSHDVIKFMYDLGYEIFDLNVAAAWQHGTDRVSPVVSKPRTIGFDFLFVKKIDSLQFDDDAPLAKFAGLCELFGFRDYGLAAIQKSGRQSEFLSDAVAEMMRNNDQDQAHSSKLRRVMRRILSRRAPLWPPLH